VALKVDACRCIGRISASCISLVSPAHQSISSVSTGENSAQCRSVRNIQFHKLLSKLAACSIYVVTSCASDVCHHARIAKNLPELLDALA
jgi:hypothetical protein